MCDPHYRRSTVPAIWTGVFLKRFLHVAPTTPHNMAQRSPELCKRADGVPWSELQSTRLLFALTSHRRKSICIAALVQLSHSSRASWMMRKMHLPWFHVTDVALYISEQGRTAPRLNDSSFQVLEFGPSLEPATEAHWEVPRAEEAYTALTCLPVEKEEGRNSRARPSATNNSPHNSHQKNHLV